MALQTQSVINQRVERNGQVVETLGVVQESQGSDELAQSSQGAETAARRFKPGDIRPPTLTEVLLDYEYLDEL